MRAVVAVSTEIAPGMRTSAIGHATDVKAEAALRTYFDSRSIFASDLQIEREANAFVAVRRGHADQFVRHLEWLPNAPRLLPAAAGKGIRTMAKRGETRMTGSTKSSGKRPSGKIQIPPN